MAELLVGSAGRKVARRGLVNLHPCIGREPQIVIARERYDSRGRRPDFALQACGFDGRKLCGETGRARAGRGWAIHDNGLLFAAVAETNLAYAMALGRLGKMISYARYSADIFAENMLDDDD